jgi:hypothetical protein
MNKQDAQKNATEVINRLNEMNIQDGHFNVNYCLYEVYITCFSGYATALATVLFTLNVEHTKFTFGEQKSETLGTYNVATVKFEYDNEN